ncbi:hypothetical protein CXB51_009134 [Gossypium anomalum]|uniref:Reverse transcriptase zinc-binding domain-containing protein n=1 Tax=Gossypium anomalum TaxID=47600 RepID=A0A8J5YTR2_9ROSI|nr:hypothetical protein CXB51_009134 [Gossypium anomalum]
MQNGAGDLRWIENRCGIIAAKPLRVEFPRLFRLALNKSGLVKEFSSLNEFKEPRFEAHSKAMPSQPQRKRKKGPLSPFGSTSAIGEEISGDESVGRSRCQRGIKSVRRSDAHGGPAGEERRLKVGARARPKLAYYKVNWADFFSHPLLDREIIMVSRLKEAVSCMVLTHEEEDRFAFDRIWKLKMPPKAKSFLWLVSIDRIPTKKFLSRRGVKFGQSGNGFPWYERESDTSDFFSFCNNVLYPGVVKSLWLISVSAACWSVRSVYDELKVNERIWWVYPVRSWIDVKKFKSSGRFWCPPCFGWIKFNRDSFVAEVGAISFALEVFLEMGWKGCCSLIIEVGSTDVFCWVENKGSRPVEKEGNAMALVMAVAGLKRQGMFKA